MVRTELMKMTRTHMPLVHVRVWNTFHLVALALCQAISGN